MVDALGRVHHVRRVGEILRQPLAAGIREGHVHHLAAPLGVHLEELLEGQHAAHDVLGRLHAVGPGDDAARSDLGAQGGGGRRALGRRRLFFEHAGVGPEWGGERRRRRPAGRGVAGPEVGLPLVAVEPAGRVAGHAVEQLGRDVVGQHAEHGGRGEGGVQEVHRAQVGPPVGQHPPEQREVVVLDEHGVALGRPRHDDVGHGLVVGPVALPGRPPVAVEAGAMRQVEQVVVDVPERRVGDDVVGLPVDVVVDHDRHEVEPVLGHAPLGDRLAVRRPHRHRGPRRPAAGEEPVQRGGQPTGRRHGHQRAVGIGAEGEGAAVGDDDGLAHAALTAAAPVRRGRPARARPAARRPPGGAARAAAGCDGCAPRGRPGPGGAPRGSAPRR